MSADAIVTGVFGTLILALVARIDRDVRRVIERVDRLIERLDDT